MNVPHIPNGSAKKADNVGQFVNSSYMANITWNGLKSGMNTNLHVLWKMKVPKFCGISKFNVVKARRPDLIVIKKVEMLDN